MASILGIVNHSSHPLVQEDGSAVNLGMTLRATGPQYSLIHFPPPQPGESGVPQHRRQPAAAAASRSRSKPQPQPHAGWVACLSGADRRPRPAWLFHVPGSRSAVEGARLHGGVPARWPLHPGYMHSFGGTASFWVLVEQPLSVSVPAMVRGQLSGEPVAGSLRWFPEHPVGAGRLTTCLSRTEHSKPRIWHG